MRNPLRRLANEADGAGEAPPDPELAPLRMLAAPMLALTGIEATLDLLGRARASRAETAVEAPAGLPRTSEALVWAPSLLAPVAAAAQLAHLSRPSEAVSAASRVLNAAVVGAGVGAMADMLLGYRHRRQAPSLSPLAVTAAGLLALLIDRQERAIRERRERLEKRARIVERLVPKRRARLDRVVVHV